MSANPPPPVGPVPVAWYSSQKFKAYVGSWLALVVGWLMQCLSTDSYEWKALAISSLGMVLLVVNDWRRAEIISPLPSQNLGNVAPWKPTP